MSYQTLALKDYQYASGIYKITNTITGKVYIGSSKNIAGRWKTHLQMLRSKSHHAVRLQTSWNRYGFKNHAFRVIEFCSLKSILKREQHYLDRYKAYDKDHGYNVSHKAGSKRKYHWTKEERKIISDRVTALSQNPDHKKKLVLAGKKPWLRRGYRKMQSEAHKGYVTPESTKRKLSKALKGRTFTEETTKKFVLSAGGKPFDVIDINTNKKVGRWLSQQQCGRDLKIHAKHISSCLKGQRKRIKNYKFRY